VPIEPSRAPAASLRGVVRRYPSASSSPSPSSIEALSGVDLDLPRGAVTALLGVNGAGKTTLLRLLAGLLPPSAGELSVLGCEQPAAAGPRRSRALRRRLSYVPQELALDPEMTGRETLALFATLHGVAWRERGRRVDALAQAFGTTEPLGRPVAVWSGGQKRRLHLAAGMLHDPEILLLDEPTAGLDVPGCDFLWAELARRARAGATVVVATHDLPAAERQADFVVILDRGRVAAAGPPGELAAGAAPPTLLAAFRRVTGKEPEPPAAGPGGGGGEGRGRR
jgi:ABC-2 type transport system ATP-binding protein